MHRREPVTYRSSDRSSISGRSSIPHGRSITHGRSTTNRHTASRIGGTLLSLGLITSLLAGCTIPTAEERAAGTQGTAGSSATQLPKAGVPKGQGPATISDQQANALQQQWQRFIAQYPDASLSMTLLPVGAQRGTAPLELGFAPSVAAAETLRVPISLAAVQKSGGDGDVGGDLITALNANDAKAAARLWASLGNDAQAAKATTEALRQAGDTVTKVQKAEPLRSEWLPANQVRFAAGLACLPAAEYIRSAMAAANPDQQFGVANYNQAQISNGWVTVQGATTVRQMVILDVGGPGFVALSVTARAKDGKKESAQVLLTRMAQWMMHQLRSVPAGRCP